MARIDAERACNDPPVKPEDDDGGKFPLTLLFNPMPVRSSRAMMKSELFPAAGATKSCDYSGPRRADDRIRHNDSAAHITNTLNAPNAARNAIRAEPNSPTVK